MKNVLITGASSGLGKAMAEYLFEMGYQVVGTSRKVIQTNLSYKMFQLDVNDEASVKACVAQFKQKIGPIDVLINNAGYGLLGPIEETTIEEAKAQFETNFFGVVRMTQAVLPLMRAQSSGLIINISSVGGLIGLPFQGFYSASKFALEGWVEALRMEIDPLKKNIRIMNVNPGDYATSFPTNRKFTQQLSSLYKEQCEGILKIYEENEKSGADPKKLSRFIAELIKNENKNQPRYLSANFLEKTGVLLKKCLSSSAFEKMMKRIYLVK